MFSRTGYVDGREWAAMVAGACALVLAVVLAAACLVKAVAVARAWRERERVGWGLEGWDSETEGMPKYEGMLLRSTSAAGELYPDPVCEWCGGIMDGRGCQCDGGEM